MSEHLLTVVCVLLAGYLLVALELFVVPGFGKAGVLGIVALLLGTSLAFRWLGVEWGIAAVVLVLASATAIIAYIPRSRIGREVVHRSSLERARAVETTLAAGAEGEADSDLRPAGIARFGEIRESVVTAGEFIAHGNRVRVVHVDGARIVVEQIDVLLDAQAKGA